MTVAAPVDIGGARLHRMVVWRMTLIVGKRTDRAKQEECGVEELRQDQGGQKVLQMRSDDQGDREERTWCVEKGRRK